MCGLAGFVGITDENTRYKLVVSLGIGIDSRGKDAIGYVSSGDTIRYGRALGEWGDASARFFISAASGPICMMHARYATIGRNTMTNAHPFCIKRDNRTVLWGAHNGILDTYQIKASAKAHNRKFTVDSREFFELLADQEFEKINNLDGYGVATWLDADKDKRNRLNIARLSEDGQICLSAVKGGGFVYASTKSILGNALIYSGLEEDSYFEFEVGETLVVRADDVFKGWSGIKLAEEDYSMYSSYGTHGIYHGSQAWSYVNDAEPDSTEVTSSGKPRVNDTSRMTKLDRSSIGTIYNYSRDGDFWPWYMKNFPDDDWGILYAIPDDKATQYNIGSGHK